ncbi:MAG TPA: hypothetical protein PKK10_17505 [Woeseiaceae bacterium]|nr:hypothetical protein [Woeseiaceae bacterium]
MLNSVNYMIYISFSVFITVFVSRTLSKNGLTFLVAGFRGNRELAASTNHLLVVGFYLVNLGFVLLRMRTGVTIDSFEQLIVYQASGLGLVLLVLGLAHFFNMYVISRISRSNLDFLDRISENESAA